MSKTRILFEGHDLKFLTHVIEHYKINHRYHVDVFTYEGHIIKDHREILRIFPEIDIIFSEWGLGNLQWFSHHKLPGQKLVVRIHSQEFSTNYLAETQWENVDKVIVVGPYMKTRFDQLFPGVSDKCEVIYNLIDTDSFNLEKSADARYTLGLLGILPMHKSPHRALEILKELRKSDDRYTLHVKGRRPDEVAWLWQKPEEQAYYTSFYESIRKEGLEDVVFFDPQGSDVPQWFRKIGFILSPSNHESFHMAIAEGMAAGTIPVIRNWTGSELLYPLKYVYSSNEQAVTLIRQYAEQNDFIPEALELQRFCREKFDLRTILPKYDKILLPEFRPAEIRKEYFELLRQRNEVAEELEISRKQRIKAEDELSNLIRQQEKYASSNQSLVEEIRSFASSIQTQQHKIREQVDIVSEKVQTKETLMVINQKQLTIIENQEHTIARQEQSIHLHESLINQQQEVIRQLTEKSELQEKKNSELFTRLENTGRERDTMNVQIQFLSENLNGANKKLQELEENTRNTIQTLNEEKTEIRRFHESEFLRVRQKYEAELEETRNEAQSEKNQLREQHERESGMLKQLMTNQIVSLESQLNQLRSDQQAALQRMDQERQQMQAKLDQQREISHGLEKQLLETYESLSWKIGALFIKKPGDLIRGIRQKLFPAK